LREGRGHWERLLREGGRRGDGPHREERAGRSEWGAGRRNGGVGQVGVGRQFGGGIRGEGGLGGQHRAEVSSGS